MNRNIEKERRIFKNRRGSALVIVALTLMVTLISTAFAVDLGMLFMARNEAQRTADAAALAGVAALVENPGDQERVKRVVREIADQNRVRKEIVPITDEDIGIRMTSDTFISVNVRRIKDRGNAVPTIFAQIFGLNEVDVEARATAGFSMTDQAPCMSPFIVPDAWDDANGNGSYDTGEIYDHDVTGYGTHWRDGDGQYVADRGRPITLYPATADETLVPSWYFLYRLPGSQGGDDIRESIANISCPPDATVKIGQMVQQEPGATVGPVKQGLEDRIALDPGAYYDPMTGNIEGSVMGDNWRASPRILNIALFDPRDDVVSGAHDVRVSNFAGVFVEQTQGNDIVGRFLPIKGVGGGTRCEENSTCSPFMRYIHLIE